MLFAVSCVAIVWAWASVSSKFYDQVIPFYDSLSYQEGYHYTTQTLDAEGPIGRFAATWRESGNNVVLYKFFAALCGDLLPHSKAGLYVYLFGIHLIATAALFHTVLKFNGSVTLALMAVSAWWLTTPFGLLRDGIGDQRIDLASGSFLLLVAALGLQWVRQPTRCGATLTGIATALAMLHRPIMAAALGGIGIIFFGAARLRHGKVESSWISHMLWAAGPIAVIALPWLLTHFDYLRTYYLEFNVDVGNGSFGAAFRFNSDRFIQSFGITSASVLLSAFIYAATRFRINRTHMITVILGFAAPLSVMVITKSAGNYFVAQMALGLPMLTLAAFTLPRKNRAVDSLTALSVASLLLVTTVVATSFRLQKSLAQERPNARPEVEAVLIQIAALQPTGRMAAFHDQPANIGAFAAIARDSQLGLTAGTAAYHPFNFGLTAEEAEIRDPQRIRSALTQMLEKVKKSDEFLILPTQETENRLWAGLFSHQMIPGIRLIVAADPDFSYAGKSSAIDGVEFDLFRCRPNR
jgi:MFS family permease